MERVKFQRETVQRLLTKYAEIINRSPLPNQEVEVVFDEQHDHYFLTTLGWRKDQRIKGNIVVKHLERVSPLAVPALLDIGRVPVGMEAGEALLSEASDALIEEAMQTDPLR